MQGQRCAKKTTAIVVEFEAERLGQPSGTSRDEFERTLPRQPSQFAHAGRSDERFAGAKQDGARLPGFAADDVRAGMDSIASIRVESFGRAKHGLISRCATAVGMGRGIAASAQVGFDLDQSKDQAIAVGKPPDEPTADQLGGHLTTISGEECLAQPGA